MELEFTLWTIFDFLAIAPNLLMHYKNFHVQKPTNQAETTKIQSAERDSEFENTTETNLCVSSDNILNSDPNDYNSEDAEYDREDEEENLHNYEY